MVQRENLGLGLLIFRSPTQSILSEKGIGRRFKLDNLGVDWLHTWLDLGDQAMLSLSFASVKPRWGLILLLVWERCFPC